jgi:hypothetical protein
VAVLFYINSNKEQSMLKKLIKITSIIISLTAATHSASTLTITSIENTDTDPTCQSYATSSQPTSASCTITITGTNFLPDPTPTSYTTNGLVLHLDAINNTCQGDTNHATDTTIWCNLVDSTNSPSLQNTPLNNNWRPDSFYFTGLQYFQGTTDNLPLGDTPNTHEIVYDATKATTNNPVFLHYGSPGCTNTVQAIFIRSSTQISTGWGCIDNNFSVSHFPNLYSGPFSIATTYDLAKEYGFINNYLSPDVTNYTDRGTRSGPLLLGADLSLQSQHYATGLALSSIRIYDRVLTPTELFHNCATDKHRFQMSQNFCSYQITIGNANCPITSLSETTITCTAPPHPEAYVDLTITSSLESTTLPDAYQYADLSITSLSAALNPLSLTLELNPQDITNSTLKSSHQSITVSTNYPDGYTLKLELSSTANNDPRLKSTLPTTPQTNDYAYIPSIPTSCTFTDKCSYSDTTFPINSYALSHATSTTKPASYFSPPPNGSPIILRQTTAPSINTTDYIWLSAKINLSQPPADYQTTLTYTLLPNI